MERTSHCIFRHLTPPVRFAQVLKSLQEAKCLCCAILEDLLCPGLNRPSDLEKQTATYLSSTRYKVNSPS